MFTEITTYVYIAIIIIASIFWYILWSKKLLWHIHLPNKYFKKHIRTPKIIISLWIIRFIIIWLLFWILIWYRFPITQIENTTKKQHTIILLDISRSMLSEDLWENRLEIAKNLLNTNIIHQNNTQYSVILFAWKAFLSISHSDDIAWIKNFIKNITPEYIRQDLPELSGTNIWDALVLSEQTTQQYWWKQNIILITDGDANIWIDPTIPAKKIWEKRISITSIGIGSKDAKDLFYTDEYGNKTFFYDAWWNKISAQINEEALKRISSLSYWWRYFIWNDMISIQNAFKDIEEFNKPEYEKIKKTIFIPLAPIFIILFLIFLYSEQKIYTHITKRFQL